MVSAAGPSTDIVPPLWSGSDYALILMILGKVADAGSNRNGAASSGLTMICGGHRLEGY